MKNLFNLLTILGVLASCSTTKPNVEEEFELLHLHPTTELAKLMATDFKIDLKNYTRHGVATYTTKSKSHYEFLLKTSGFAPNNEHQLSSEYETNEIITNDEYFEDQYALTFTGISDAWAITEGSPDVVVAIIDTGVDIYHPELVSSIASTGYNSYFGQEGLEYVIDDRGHGTQVTGVIAADKDNGIGIAGAAPEVSILPIKANTILYDSSGKARPTSSFRDSSIIDGILYAIEQEADIINISVGNTSYNVLVQQAVDQAEAAGVLVVAAAGNTGKQQYVYPASLNYSLSVGSVSDTMLKSFFTTYNDKLDVMAPGHNIVTTTKDGYYTVMSGTSFASPYVAAMAAMLKSVYPEMTPADIRSKLRETAIDAGAPGFDIEYGYGVANIYQALLSEMGEMDSSIGTITPPNINTYFVGDSLDFTGFEAEVIDNNDGSSEYFYKDDVYFYFNDPDNHKVELNDGYVLTDSDSFTEIHFEINTVEFNYDSDVDGEGFSVTVYPYPAYQMDFKSLGNQTINLSRNQRQSMLLGDTWLVKANEPTLLYSQSMVPQGLVIGDDNEEDFATDSSFLTSSLWGVGGAANGLPIIQSIYLKAYSVNTQVEFFINNESVGFDSLNTEAGDDWIVFTIDQTTLRVGHLEMRLLQAAGDTPITLEELSIVSSNDGDPSLMDMLFFANDIEALDTCVDQSTFLTDHQFDYDSYVGSFNTTFTGLNLLDLSTPESNRDELRVTLGDKWAMMVNLHGEEAEGFGFRGSNQATNNTQTFWMGWSLILILFTFFWKKRSSDILR